LSKYTFHEGQPAANFKPSFERYLFNEERHLISQSVKGWKTYSLIDESTQTQVAQINFHITDGIASSPHRAPFGSIEFSQSLSADALLGFINECENKLKKKKVKKIIIKDAPQIYRPHEAATLSVLLLSLKYEISSNEICSSIKVDEVPWENKISKDELYHFKRCQREGLTFRQLETTKVVEVYRFIEHCRKERGMSLSMTLDQLVKTVRSCPKDFLLFAVFQNEEMVAASIVLKINDRILYDFYYGHSKASNNLSPVVFLLDGQYTFGKLNGFQILDLGTSMLNDKVNFSLLNFKSQVGGVPSMKLTFEKELR
jgi:hypothetical protein